VYSKMEYAQIFDKVLLLLLTGDITLGECIDAN
jgi:hypothetical protein